MQLLKISWPKKCRQRPWNVWDSQARGGSQEEKREGGSNAVEFLGEKTKVHHDLTEEELQLRKDQQDIVVDPPLFLYNDRLITNLNFWNYSWVELSHNKKK